MSVLSGKSLPIEKLNFILLKTLFSCVYSNQKFNPYSKGFDDLSGYLYKVIKTKGGTKFRPNFILFVSI